MKTAELTEIRNELYNAMPSGQIDAFELIKVISNHLNRLDRFIESYASHPPMSTEQYVLDNGMGTGTQYSSGAIHSLGEFPATKTMSAEQVEDKDLIIHGLQEGAESWKAEYDNCRALLQELVSLKVMKENLYKGNPDGKEYAERKPKAWEAAKQFLSTYQHEVFSTTPSVKADGFKKQWQEMESEIQKHMDEWDEGARLRAGQATIDLSKIIINS